METPPLSTYMDNISLRESQISLFNKFFKIGFALVLPFTVGWWKFSTKSRYVAALCVLLTVLTCAEIAVRFVLTRNKEKVKNHKHDDEEGFMHYTIKNHASVRIRIQHTDESQDMTQRASQEITQRGSQSSPRGSQHGQSIMAHARKSADNHLGLPRNSSGGHLSTGSHGQDRQTKRIVPGENLRTLNPLQLDIDNKP